MVNEILRVEGLSAAAAPALVIITQLSLLSLFRACITEELHPVARDKPQGLNPHREILGFSWSQKSRGDTEAPPGRWHGHPQCGASLGSQDARCTAAGRGSSGSKKGKGRGQRSEGWAQPPGELSRNPLGGLPSWPLLAVRSGSGETFRAGPLPPPPEMQLGSPEQGRGE